MKKNIKRRFAFMMIFILSCNFLVSCNNAQQDLADNTYRIYYLNSTSSKLLEKDYETSIKDTKELLDLLSNEMQKKQKDKEFNVVKPENVSVEKIEYNENVRCAIINFSKEYNECSNTIKMLINAAYTKCFTQIEGVEYVQIFVDGNELKRADGNSAGVFSANDFIDDASDGIESVEWKTLKLYYSNKSGEKLVPANISVAYNKNVSLEKVIVEKLIKGPNDSSLSATLPSDVKLLNVSVNNKICYVNLSSQFLTGMVNVSGEVSLYSIVNSLCALDNIESVKILINGDSNKVLRETINLDNTFQTDYNIIEK